MFKCVISVHVNVCLGIQFFCFVFPVRVRYVCYYVRIWSQNAQNNTTQHQSVLTTFSKIFKFSTKGMRNTNK